MGARPRGSRGQLGLPLEWGGVASGGGTGDGDDVDDGRGCLAGGDKGEKSLKARVAARVYNRGNERDRSKSCIELELPALNLQAGYD